MKVSFSQLACLATRGVSDDVPKGDDAEWNTKQPGNDVPHLATSCFESCKKMATPVGSNVECLNYKTALNGARRGTESGSPGALRT
jgi:hypothetical protein